MVNLVPGVCDDRIGDTLKYSRWRNCYRTRTLAKLRHERCKRTESEIARALQGNWRDEYLFALGQALELYKSYHEQLRLCDAKIEAQLKTFQDRSAGK